MKLQKFFYLAVLLALSSGVFSQQLKPGFNKKEYLDLLKISAQFGDSSYRASIPVPVEYKLAYRSPVMGLDNMWDLYTKNSDLAIISLRGTTEKSENWLANFYAAMVPAKGELTLSEENIFSYQLASNPKAAVHVGWLVSTAFLSQDILPKIDSVYQSGIKDMIIMGHSQGGAIAFLLTAHLRYLQQQQMLPSDIQFKTYCSAGPKPGNLYFAYDYEALTQQGWAYNVVNSADWVPEVPVSIQTVDDFNEVNPFSNIKETIRKQKFLTRVMMNHAYNKLYKPTRRAQRNYQKILGNITSRSVQKVVPGFVPPKYYASNDYVRTGTTIVLQADETYYLSYPNDENKIFTHHLHPPYLMLAEKIDIGSSNSEPIPTSLEGTWEMVYISGRRIALEGLYPDKKPNLQFDLTNQRVSGHTGCNSFTGNLMADAFRMDFSAPFAMTKMMCQGEGEQVFLDTVKKIKTYQIEGETLSLIADDIPLMRFVKKQ